MTEQPAVFPQRRGGPSVDEILETLVASGVLETLEIANDDVRKLRTDTNLLETLTIAYELLMSFDDAGVLDTFFRLPKRDQANFLRWIGSTDDPEVRARRTATFVSALEIGPLEHPSEPMQVRDQQA